MKKLIIFYLCLFIASPCWSASYYVSQSGNGAADGLTYATRASVATMNAGAGIFATLDDDIIYLCGTITTAPNTTDGGTAGHVVTYMSCEVANSASDDDPMSIETDAENSHGFIVDVNYVTLDDIIITNAGDMGIAITGTNCTVQNSTIKDWGQDGDSFEAGIYFSESNCLIENNDIYITDSGSIALGSGCAAIISGTTVKTGAIIQDNIIGQNFNLTRGMRILESGTSSYIRRNIICSSAYGMINEDADDVEISYNTIIVSGSGSTEYAIYYEAGGVDNLTISLLNNTIIDIGDENYGIYTKDTGAVNFDSVTIKNNIFVGFASYAVLIDGSITPTENYNDYYGNTANLYYNGGAQSIGASSITTDPDLYTLDGLRYRIHGASPCKDNGDNTVWSGTASVTDIEGNVITDALGNIAAEEGTVDIGAFEYQFMNGKLDTKRGRAAAMNMCKGFTVLNATAAPWPDNDISNRSDRCVMSGYYPVGFFSYPVKFLTPIWYLILDIL